ATATPLRRRLAPPPAGVTPGRPDVPVPRRVPARGVGPRRPPVRRGAPPRRTPLPPARGDRAGAVTGRAAPGRPDPDPRGGAGEGVREPRGDVVIRARVASRFARAVPRGRDRAGAPPRRRVRRTRPPPPCRAGRGGGRRGAGAHHGGGGRGRAEQSARGAS